MQVGIVAQKGNSRAAYLADDLRTALGERDVATRLDEETAAALGIEGTPVETFDACDFLVAIGGDGTFLFAARHADETPIVGVNLGEVGFLNAVSPDDAEKAVLAEVEAFRDGTMTVREAPRLVARTADWESIPAANEIVIQGPRRGHGSGVDYQVRVDGSLYSGGHADGVLVATPTGSTAYNLSERGPLVHPHVDAMVLNEMGARDGMPPLAVGLDSDITVTITETEGAIAVSDGREPYALETPVDVHVESGGPPMRIAGPQTDFFEALGKLS